MTPGNMVSGYAVFRKNIPLSSSRYPQYAETMLLRNICTTYQISQCHDMEDKAQT